MLVLNFPGNPTSQCVEIDFFEKVIELAKAEDIWVVHDLAYADIVFDDDFMIRCIVMGERITFCYNFEEKMNTWISDLAHAGMTGAAKSAAILSPLVITPSSSHRDPVVVPGLLCSTLNIVRRLDRRLTPSTEARSDSMHRSDAPADHAGAPRRRHHDGLGPPR